MNTSVNDQVEDRVTHLCDLLFAAKTAIHDGDSQVALEKLSLASEELPSILRSAKVELAQSGYILGRGGDLTRFVGTTDLVRLRAVQLTALGDDDSEIAIRTARALRSYNINTLFDALRNADQLSSYRKVGSNILAYLEQCLLEKGLEVSFSRDDGRTPSVISRVAT